jgi:hypothetical protein
MDNQAETNSENIPKTCLLTGSGITILGVFVPWALIVVVAIVILYFLYKKGMFDDEFGAISVASTPIPVGIASTVAQVASPALPVGEVAKLFGHNKAW